MPDEAPRNSDEATPRISALRAARGDSFAVTILVDDEVGPTVPSEAVHEHGLEVGMPWTPALAAALGRLDAMRRCRRDALRALERAARSRADVEGRLRRKGHPQEAIEAVCDALERQGLLDDRGLAEGMVRGSVARSGERLLEVKLRRKGIDASLTREVIGEAIEGRDVLEDACRLLTTRLRSLPGDLEPMVRRRRLYAWLARRGYDPETCRDAIERVLPDES
ncbi:MAG: regulatory protein RecX [Phycisphaerales bacterium]|nr:regulatory protein RecX [Phycisphaerales bacterium]